MQHLGFTRLGNPHGYPLAIIHGWGCDSSFLRPLAEMFPERDIYLIDLPGYGKSAHLAPLASDFTTTTVLLINTIPYAADVISWSFGTLYALHAISAISSPCLSPESYTHLLLHNPKLTELECESSICTRDGAIESAAATALKDAPIKFVSTQSRTSDASTIEAESTPNYSTPTLRTQRHCERRIAATAEATTLDATGAGAASAAGSSKPQRSLLDCSLCPSAKRPYVRSLITICGSPRFPSDPNWDGMSAMKILKCNTVLTPHRVEMILRLFYRMMAANATPKEAAYIKEVALSHPPVPFEVLQAGIQAVSYIDERPALQYLKVPSLHLFGAQDTLVPSTIAPYLNQPPLHTSYVFPYSSHNPYLSEPERFKRVVSEFFEQVAPMDFSPFSRREQKGKVHATIGTGLEDNPSHQIVSTQSSGTALKSATPEASPAASSAGPASAAVTTEQDNSGLSSFMAQNESA